VRLRAIAAFEIEYRLRQKSTWLHAVVLTTLGILAIAAGADSVQPVINSPMSIAGLVAIIGMIGMLVTAAIFGDAATRDVATGSHPLFFTLPITKLDYLGGRFLGALAVNAGLLAFIPIGLALGTFIPFNEGPGFLPFDARTYVEPFFTLGLTNLFFSATILFTAAALTRNALSAYLAAIALFMSYLIAGNEIGRSLDDSVIGGVLDPFGIVLFRVVTAYMSPAEQAVAHLGLPAILVWNRLLWIATAVAMLLFLYRRFRFDLAKRSVWGFGFGRSTDQTVAPVPTVEVRKPHTPRPTPTRSFGASTHVRQVISIAWRALGDIVTSRIFQVVLAAAVVVIFLFGWDVGQIVFDTSTYHVTHLVASVFRGPAAAAVVVLVGLYAGELVWKDRDTRVAEMIDTEPMPTWVPLTGKFLALVGMILVLQAVFMVSGIVLQAVRGFYDFEPWLYIRILFGYLLALYVLFAAVSFVLHVVVNQKHLGHLAVVLFYAAFAFAGQFGIKHGMFLYNSDPGWVYSDMNGFGPFVQGFVWFKLYWGAWALLLLVVAGLFWIRGTESGARKRLALARMRFTGGAVRAAALAVVLIVTFGGFVFYNTNVLNTYRTDEERFEEAVRYERRFGQFRDAPQPRIVSARLRVDIHPQERFVDLSGTYALINKTGQQIDSVHVVVSTAVEPRQMDLDRKATLVVDEKLPWTYRIYDLERPLQPGDSIRLTFDHRVQPKGFPESGVNTAIAENGAYFDRRWMPSIGYQQSYELSEERDRHKHGLPIRPEFAPVTDERGRQWRSVTRDADLVDVDAVISTAGDQIAVTTGALVREWREGGRRFFHYKTETPVSFGMPFMSARYAMREDKWKDVTLKVLYHPAHHFNIDRLIRSMKASLEYYTENLGPFQFKELRIAEFPRYANFARGHPQTISFGEGTSFLTRVEDGDVDRPFFVAAHEIAHQWWGGQVAGARVEGVGMVSETLAMYSSMMVMERTYGRDMVKKFYDFNMDMYLRGRSGGGGRDEMPLIRVRDQNHVYYHKGAVAMYVLKERIGEERVNAALRSFLKKWRAAGPPYPTSFDLYSELQAITPDSVKPLLTDLFETITLYGVSVSAASAERVAPGLYRVSIEIEGRKVRAGSPDTTRTGSGKSERTIIRPPKETETPMDEMVEIGIYEMPHGKPAELEYLQRHRIKSGKQTITVMVKGEPWRVGVDPRHWLIQRDKESKVVELTRIRPRPGSDTTWRAEYRKPRRAVKREFQGL
jgi:ABC-2 type transport system permease protein